MLIRKAIFSKLNVKLGEIADSPLISQNTWAFSVFQVLFRVLPGNFGEIWPSEFCDMVSHDAI